MQKSHFILLKKLKIPNVPSSAGSICNEVLGPLARAQLFQLDELITTKSDH